MNEWKLFMMFLGANSENLTFENCTDSVTLWCKRGNSHSNNNTEALKNKLIPGSQNTS